MVSHVSVHSDAGFCLEVFDEFSGYFVFSDTYYKLSLARDIYEFSRSIKFCKTIELTRRVGKTHFELAMRLTGFSVYSSGILLGTSRDHTIYFVADRSNTGYAFYIDRDTVKNLSHKLVVPAQYRSAVPRLDKKGRFTGVVEALKALFGENVGGLAVHAVRWFEIHRLKLAVDYNNHTHAGSVSIDELLFKVIEGNAERTGFEDGEYTVSATFKSYEEMLEFARDVEDQYLALKAIYP